MKESWRRHSCGQTGCFNIIKARVNSSFPFPKLKGAIRLAPFFIMINN